MERNLEWHEGKSKEITFIVTKDCQLACKYCYLVGKNSNERMSFDTAKKAIDYILSHEEDEEFAYSSVVFDFIGGEPLLEVALIDQICDYIKIEMYKRNHHWFNSYRFSMTTNGINYDSDAVQNFIRKNHAHLSITITIDGTKQKHDINRIWKKTVQEIELESQGETIHERGSYENVVRNIPLWLKQFPESSTKVTISTADIPYIKDSVLHLYSLGIHHVHINCVFENVWKDGDDKLFEEQLVQLADSIIDNNLYEDFDCSFFDRSLGQPLNIRSNRNYCGAGMMLSIDASGNFYPCTRFVQYSLRSKPTRKIGNINEGIDKNKVRPFKSLSRTIQSTQECIECEVASGCAWCQGENYDCADTETIFQRSTAICKMHKARVRANQYYYTKLDAKLGHHDQNIKVVDNKCNIDKTPIKQNTVVVLLDDSAVSFCTYTPSRNSQLMPYSVLERIINKAISDNLNLQFVYPAHELPEAYSRLIETVPHKSIKPANTLLAGNAIIFNSLNEMHLEFEEAEMHVLRLNFNELGLDSTLIKIDSLLKKVSRLNIVFVDESEFNKDIHTSYKEDLTKLSEIILRHWQSGHKVKCNLITDRLYLSKMNNCGAGSQSVTLAPNGRYYICPAFYYDNPDNSCGDLETGVDIRNQLLYNLNHAPICSTCSAYHCKRCIYLNKKKTLEVNTPSYEQCDKSNIEMEVIKEFFDKWEKTVI